MKLCQSRNIRTRIRGTAIRRFLTSWCKVEIILLLNVSHLFKTFRRLPEYTSNVCTPTLEILCKATLLRSRISAVSQTVKRRSVSITSLTSVNALSLVRVGLPTPLKQLDYKKNESRDVLVYTGIFRLLWKFYEETLLRLKHWHRHFSDFLYIVSNNKISSH